MSAEKFEVMKDAIIQQLSENELTQSELVAAVTSYFQASEQKFQGSIPWHMEWVKLHLEFESVIERIKSKTAVRYRLVGNNLFLKSTP